MLEGISSNKQNPDSFKSTPFYQSNVRYQIAKRKIEDVFINWMNLSTTKELIDQLIKEVKGNTNIIQNAPPALFQSLKFSMRESSLLLNNSMHKSPHTPPKSPYEFDKIGRKSQIENIQSPPDSPDQKEINSKKQNEYIISKQDQQQVKKDTSKKSEIPQFYFANGKPLDEETKKQHRNIINQIFDESAQKELDPKGFMNICKKLCQLPEFLGSILFLKIDTSKSGKITKDTFIKFWDSEFVLKSPLQRCFYTIKKINYNYIEPDDFKPIMKLLLQTHPGLEFLQSTPEFQDRYADTVIQRIFYKVDTDDDGRITYREFKNSNLFQVLQQVDNEEDINKIREYFSYEHFYVLYCKFWELDTDHDFFINKEEFSKYSGHALSSKTVDRIFQQIPRKFKSQQIDKMSYEDFIWFILSEEDKTTVRSLQYWFKLIDLDQNGIITGNEMEYFYEEQRQRLEFLNHEVVFFEDIVCQMADMLKPTNDIMYTLDHFIKNKEICGIFFNILINLNKFVAYEQRDAFAIKNELTQNPGYSEWDRFAANEYIRLAMEEDNPENSEVFESMDPWDSDHEDGNAGGSGTIGTNLDDTKFNPN